MNCVLGASGAISSHAPIVNGANTILVPRALFLDSKLKARFDAGNFFPIGTAPFYGEDLGASAVSAAVAGLVAHALSAGDAKFLLDRLLEDASGVVVRRAVAMYDRAPRANLPEDVVKILPWSPVTLGPTGAVPQDFWQKIGWAATELVNVLPKQGERIGAGGRGRTAMSLCGPRTIERHP